MCFSGSIVGVVMNAIQGHWACLTQTKGIEGARKTEMAQSDGRGQREVWANGKCRSCRTSACFSTTTLADAGPPLRYLFLDVSHFP